GDRLDVPDDGRVVRLAGPPEAPQRPARVPAEGPDERSAPPEVDGGDGSAVRAERVEGPGALGRSPAGVRARVSVPVPVRPGGEAVAVRGGRDLVGRGVRPLEGARPDERDLRRVGTA